MLDAALRALRSFSLTNCKIHQATSQGNFILSVWEKSIDHWDLRGQCGFGEQANINLSTRYVQLRSNARVHTAAFSYDGAFYHHSPSHLPTLALVGFAGSLFWTSA
jgi:hypothetical protein